MTKQPYIESGLKVIDIELCGIQGLKQAINTSFITACELLQNCPGRIIVMGMGKSGHIANKIASTLASTGSPAFFVHPAEASHGDLGMITQQDVVIAISNSGNTPEILTILPLIKRLGVKLIALTGKTTSLIAEAADVHLDVSVEKEACPHNLAPTASTTAALVMGDALAIALLEARGFTKEDFAFSHPGGKLGKQLLLKVRDIMHCNADVPKVISGSAIKEALVEMSAKRLGMTAVVDKKNRVLGVFTDGDLRRALEKNIDIHHATVDEVMTKNPITATPDMLAVEVVALMEKNKIFPLLVVDTSSNEKLLIGAFNMHDLFQAGVI